MLKKDIEEIKIFINEMKKEKEDEKKKQIEAQKYSLINFKSLIVKDVKKINVLKNWIDHLKKNLRQSFYIDFQEMEKAFLLFINYVIIKVLLLLYLKKRMEL